MPEQQLDSNGDHIDRSPAIILQWVVRSSVASLNLSQMNKANGVTEMFCKVNYSTPDIINHSFFQFLFIIDCATKMVLCRRVLQNWDWKLRVFTPPIGINHKDLALK